MYSPLYIKTDYSLLSSLIRIDDLIKNCLDKSITSVAICDTNLFGTMEFIKKCNKANIKPIIGLEVSFNNEKILLYAKSIEGYYNLIKIETIKNECEITLDTLKKLNKDIICICFSIEVYTLLKNIFDDLYTGVNEKSEEIKFKDNNPVFINETLYLEKYYYKYLPYIFMIRDGKTILDGIEFVYDKNYLYTYEEVIKLVNVDSINNTLKITDMCNIVFPKEIYMPKYDVEDSKKYLVSLANKGLLKRLNNNISDAYIKRLNYELDVIIKMHFEDYFLVVYDYIRYAKKNGILVGPGRGSAAGSLVCYSLGITEVDPLKYNLLFERFLNPERITMPDIDTDFPDNDRDKVINYVTEKYGRKKVAGIITFGTLKAKQAIRDVGRVLNINITDIDYLCKKIKLSETLKSLKKRSAEVSNFIDSNDKLKMLYNIESLIENNKRHTSIHAAGIVMSYKELDEILPLIKNNDLYLTEYSMEYLEELGLIKMDFLGLKNLSVIKDTLDIIQKEKNIVLDFNKIPLDDEKTLELFRKGDTVGIFQFESEGMKRFLKDLKPQDFNDISLAIALYRPGPAENIPSFVKRKNNLEKITYINNSLKDILEETCGIIVYQEQIMQIANKMAGYSYAEADLLRRAMSKKKYEILKEEETKFLNKAKEKGYTEKETKEVYDLILKFANYGFNKSHSVSYSLISYKMAYLKAHYPTCFYSSLLKIVIGSEIKTHEYLNELKKLGIKIVPPNINKSAESSYIVDDTTITLPLSTIRNVGGVIASYIVQEREKSLYKNIFDFLSRIASKTTNKKVIESLIYAHCFDDLGINITTLINNYEEIANYIDLTLGLADNNILKPEINNYENNIDDILEHERDLFGFYVTSHKTEKFKLFQKGVINIININNYLNKQVLIIGSVDKIKAIKTKTNENMAFVTVSDTDASCSLTLFPNIYSSCQFKIEKGIILLIKGKVEKRFNDYQIVVSNIEKLN